MIERRTSNSDSGAINVGDTVRVHTRWSHYAKGRRTPTAITAVVTDIHSIFYLCEGPPLPPPNDVPGTRKIGPFVRSELKKLRSGHSAWPEPVAVAVEEVKQAVVKTRAKRSPSPAAVVLQDPVTPPVATTPITLTKRKGFFL